MIMNEIICGLFEGSHSIIIETLKNTTKISLIDNMSDFLICEPPKCKILALTVNILVASSAGDGYEGVLYFLL